MEREWKLGQLKGGRLVAYRHLGVFSWVAYATDDKGGAHVAILSDEQKAQWITPMWTYGEHKSRKLTRAPGRMAWEAETAFREHVGEQKLAAAA